MPRYLRALPIVALLVDNEYTTPNPTGATVKVDLAGSRLTRPIAGFGLPHASSVPTVSTTRTPAFTPKAQTDKRRPRFQ